MSFEAVMPPYNVSDPTASFLNSSCLDFLLIELVPLAYRVSNELDATVTDVPTGAEASSASHNGATSSVAGLTGGSTRKMDEEEERDAVFYRLEMLGYRVGQGLVERWVLENFYFRASTQLLYIKVASMAAH
jgi:trafficking protein particle complex subunit 6